MITYHDVNFAYARTVDCFHSPLDSLDGQTVMDGSYMQAVFAFDHVYYVLDLC